MGGDEFIIIFQLSSDKEKTLNMIKEICQNITALHLQKHKELSTHCSCGIAFYPKDGLTIKELYEVADSALYQAKKHGKIKYVSIIKIQSKKVKMHKLSSFLVD